MIKNNKKQQKLKAPKKLSSFRFYWTDLIKDSIKDIERLGYTVSMKFEKDTDKEDKDLKIIKGFFNIYINNQYITTCALPYDNSRSVQLRLYEKLETIYRTLFYVKNHSVKN